MRNVEWRKAFFCLARHVRLAFHDDALGGLAAKAVIGIDHVLLPLTLRAHALALGVVVMQ